MRRRPAPISLVLTALLAGCMAADEGLDLSAAPPAAPRVAGAPVPAGSTNAAKLAAAFGGALDAPALTARLDALLARLARAGDGPGGSYRVTVLDSPVVNAFALPTGELFVTRGLLALTNDTAEAAGVLAHEMAHVTARHALARAELERRAALVSRVVTEVLADPAAGGLLRARDKLGLAGFSRTQELEADALGVRTLARAGFDPYGASRFLATLGRYAALRAASLGERPGTAPDTFATHPQPGERVAIALSAARQLGAPGLGEADHGAWVGALDGLPFGEDPREGSLRGRAYVHGRLGVGFNLPPGFTAETGAVLLGVAAARGWALRYDAVDAAEAGDLTAMLRGGWVEGVAVARVEPIAAEGLDGVTGTAAGEGWGFRLAAIRSGGKVHRFVLAARNLDAAADAAFLAAIASFRRLDPAEIAALRPLRLALHVAAQGETAEDLGGRMQGVEDPLGRFLVLNGLERGARLEAGRAYKLVRE